jgi:2-keto-4-pentenoate hydratase/2-oxohepta-3-ene-1,7-dioic acid hydratase in catechol pathway
VRLVTFDAGDGPQAGQLRDEEIVALAEPDESGLGALLRRGLSLGGGGGPGFPLADVELLPPVTDPSKIVLIGLNYLSHAREQNAEPPASPTIFAKFPNALASPGADVALPRNSSKVDYEAEVAFVIAERCKDVSEEDALRCVAGYMLLNDLSARDLQFSTPQWMPGKVFDGSAPCGPALVTPDEAGPPDAIEIALTVNGEERQSASTADLIHPVPALVSHLSGLMTLEPGDIVSTGTPAGVGSLRRPRVWLEPGDEVVIRSPQLGELVTRLV